MSCSLPTVHKSTQQSSSQKLQSLIGSRTSIYELDVVPSRLPAYREKSMDSCFFMSEEQSRTTSKKHVRRRGSFRNADRAALARLALIQAVNDECRRLTVAS